jgi:hypothetical protein
MSSVAARTGSPDVANEAVGVPYPRKLTIRITHLVERSSRGQLEGAKTRAYLLLVHHCSVDSVNGRRATAAVESDQVEFSAAG